ncbi:MAG: NfeD family protein [Oscillospiraceae bacterium]|jgi:membrane protein implicated in regulation of membrane protease activity|nr:NfeD family protein [Oscillospiraceae bacterium]
MRPEFFWLGLTVLFAIIEAASVALLSVWFIGGSLAGLIVALAGGEIWLQVVVFFAVTAVLLFSLRPLTRKYVAPKKTLTNAAANIGKTAVVIEAIDTLYGTGAVKISGVQWSAKSDAPIAEGSLVRITAIEGAKVRVEAVDTQAE